MLAYEEPFVSVSMSTMGWRNKAYAEPSESIPITRNFCLEGMFILMRIGRGIMIRTRSKKMLKATWV